MDDLRCRHADSFDAAKAAFEELCAMVDNLEAEKAERREAAIAIFEASRARRRALLEKNRRLRDKYLVLLEQYNSLAEELRDRSDSSSGGSSDEEHTCSLM